MADFLCLDSIYSLLTQTNPSLGSRSLFPMMYYTSVFNFLFLFLQTAQLHVLSYILYITTQNAHCL